MGGMPAGAVSRADRKRRTQILSALPYCVGPYVGPNASLVAQDPVRDLFVSAKDLFVEAIAP